MPRNYTISFIVFVFSLTSALAQEEIIQIGSGKNDYCEYQISRISINENKEKSRICLEITNKHSKWINLVRYLNGTVFISTENGSKEILNGKFQNEGIGNGTKGRFISEEIVFDEIPHETSLIYINSDGKKVDFMINEKIK